MTDELPSKCDYMLPDPNWDERYETIIGRGPKDRFEFLHADPIGDDLFQIMHQPLEIPGLFYGDIVRTIPGRARIPEIVEVVKPSGYTMQMLFGLNPTEDGLKVFNKLNTLGVCEPAGTNLFSMTAHPNNWPEIYKIVEVNNLTLGPFLWPLSDATDST